MSLVAGVANSYSLHIHVDANVVGIFVVVVVVVVVVVTKRLGRSHHPSKSMATSSPLVSTGTALSIKHIYSICSIFAIYLSVYLCYLSVCLSV